MSQKVPAFSVCPLDCLSPTLWADAFGEEEAEVRQMIDLLAPNAVAVCATEDGKVVFQGVLVPLLFGDALGYYLYALATAPAYRGRGYLRHALAYVRDYAAKRDVSFLLLIPASEPLAAAYRRMGFREAVPLLASVDGKEGFLSLPPTEEEIPFDGDEERLYLMTARTLPLSAFRAYLASLPEDATVLYTAHGFRIRNKKNAEHCLLCDADTTKSTPVGCKAYALADLLVPTDLPSCADPLPR